jgi:predicted amidohydrolase
MLVAAIQFAPRFKAVESNLAQMVALVETAIDRGARLIVLPELCTTGYSFMSRDEAAPFAEALNTWEEGGPSFKRMQALAGNAQVAIVWGLVEKYTGRDKRYGSLYNSQVLMPPKGAYHVHRKINLWGNDYLWATPGTENPPVVELFGKRVGIVICKDIRDHTGDNSKEYYEPGDADIVCLSASWGDGEFPSGRWIKFAKSNQVHLIVSNRYGQEGANNFGEGGICIVHPDGQVDCEGLVWSEPCIVYAEV